MRRKTILITGVSGFIGRNVAEEALRRGYRVTGIDRRRSGLSAVEFMEGDVRDRWRMFEVTRGIDCVVHLAAVTSNVEFTNNPGNCYDINVNGLLSVIDAAVRNGCKRFVYASSAAVYVDSFSEDAVIDFSKQCNHYAKTKIMNEMVAKSYEDIYGIRTTALRYFNVYGKGENEKGDYASIVALFLHAQKNGEALVVYGDGEQARDLIDVTDAARITLDVAEKGPHQIYNVGTGIATTYKSIAARIDKDHVKYVRNPLTSYQYYTRADTQRVSTVMGKRKLRPLDDGIAAMRRTDGTPLCRGGRPAASRS
jgi:nucleoside-diphosphate-sugar epimerase